MKPPDALVPGLALVPVPRTGGHCITAVKRTLVLSPCPEPKTQGGVEVPINGKSNMRIFDAA
jgi:hypothetical protein